jgi:hypothetical protein
MRVPLIYIVLLDSVAACTACGTSVSTSLNNTLTIWLHMKMVTHLRTVDTLRDCYK